MSNNFDYSVIKNYVFHEISRPVGHFLSRIAFHTSYSGTENIPTDDKPLIFCPNHISAKDPIVVAMGLKRRIRFMAKIELFSNPVVSWMLVHNYAFPVTRGKMDVRAVKYAVSVVKNGKSLAIFPEGTRSKDGAPKKGKNGAAYVAKNTGADVVPVSIYKDEKHNKLKVTYGKPIKNSDFGFTDKKSKAELTKATERIMSEITALWEEENANHVG